MRETAGCLGTRADATKGAVHSVQGKFPGSEEVGAEQTGCCLHSAIAAPFLHGNTV